jgi:hypothetical protein
MVAPVEHRQRIARLMPLDDVMRRIAERVHPVTPREMWAAAALGATLAQDIVVADPHPAAPLALIDGWAVHAESTADARPYAPAVLPQLREVAVGEALRADGDAVARRSRRAGHCTTRSEPDSAASASVSGTHRKYGRVGPSSSLARPG